ncbi:hypothetical protein V6N13_130186 [Hibiscus sabdariffa]
MDNLTMLECPGSSVPVEIQTKIKKGRNLDEKLIGEVGNNANQCDPKDLCGHRMQVVNRRRWNLNNQGALGGENESGKGKTNGGSKFVVLAMEQEPEDMRTAEETREAMDGNNIQNDNLHLMRGSWCVE